MTPPKPDASGVDVAETHVSVLFFAGDRAYKLLKPVATPYLDFSTTERRLVEADREVELNRRLAPDVYLGTADVVELDEVVDRMIVMRRMPHERRLSRLLWSQDAADIIRSVARTVATFHASLPPLLDTHEIAGRDAVSRNWADNHAEIERHVGALFDADTHRRVVDLADRYLDHHAELFDRRISDGLVRDGHGDLTADDVFVLDDGPRILDCLAFSRKLRVGDVLADIAFLTMDIDRLAGAERARSLMRWYGEYSNEHHPPSLAHHYVAYRAHVRAKVAAMRHEQGDSGSAGKARRYLELALDHLERAQLKVVLVGGAPGTGKSTLADALSGELGFATLDSDTLRKDLCGVGHQDRHQVAVGEGIYDEATSTRTYEALVEQASMLLERGTSVILDASWAREQHRQAVRSAAEANGATVVELLCDLDPETARRRVTERLRVGGDASDVRPEILADLRQDRDPWPSAVVIDTAETVARSVQRSIAAVDGHRFRPILPPETDAAR